MIHNIVLGIHIAGFIVCFFIVYMLGRRENKQKANYMVVTVVCNILELMASSEEAMITAVKMQYLGKSFVATFLLYTFVRYYNWKFPRSIIRLFWVIDIGIYFVVLTLDYHMCYYKSYEVVTVHGKKFFITEKAPFYVITMVYLLGTLVLFSYLCHKNWKTAEGRDKQILGKLSLTSIVADVIIVLSISDAAYPYDLVPMIITIFTIIIGFLIYKYGLFSTLDIAKENLILDVEEGVIVRDVEGNFQYANPKAYELIPQLKYVDKKLIERAIERLVGNTKSDTIRFNGRFFKMNNRALEDNNRALEDNNRVVGQMITFFDITDLHESNKKMEQLKIEADNANVAKSNFLANMSHEIRTPINAVLGMDEMILREANEENIIEYAMSIKRAGETLLSLVSDILDFSKIESGKMTIINEPYNVEEVITDIINTFSLRMRQKGLTFITEIDEGIPKVLIGDEVRIKQIALNILSNAYKYTKEGYVNLKITSKVNKNKCILTVSVEDTGSGIKKEALDKLFATFERIDEKKIRHIEGSGLGLNITKNLLLMMGSDIQVKSVFGRGSIFSFELEQKIVDKEPIGKIKAESIKLGDDYRKDVQFVAPNARVLVVDDNVVNLSVMKGLLKKSQVIVDVASSGADAIKMTKKKEYHLIFMDHLMPEMDGMEALARIKEMDGNLNKNTPCIVLTANAISGAKEQYMNAGFDEYMTKPVDVELLDSNLVKFLPDDLIKK